MLIWQGKGILVPFIAFGCALMTEWISEWVTKNDTFYQQHKWAPALALFLAGIFIFLISWFSKKRTKNVNQFEENEKKTPTFFFIPMEYWSYLITFYAFYILFFYTKSPQ